MKCMKTRFVHRTWPCAERRFLHKTNYSAFVWTWIHSVFMRCAKCRSPYQVWPICNCGNAESLGLYEVREVHTFRHNTTILHLWERGPRRRMWDMWNSDFLQKTNIFHVWERGVNRPLRSVWNVMGWIGASEVKRNGVERSRMDWSEVVWRAGTSFEKENPSKMVGKTFQHKSAHIQIYWHMHPHTHTHAHTHTHTHARTQKEPHTHTHTFICHLRMPPDLGTLPFWIHNRKSCCHRSSYRKRNRTLPCELDRSSFFIPRKESSCQRSALVLGFST